LQLLFDYLTLTFLEGPEEERVEHFSVATHFPKVQLEDMAQTVEAAVSWCPFWCGVGLLNKWGLLDSIEQNCILRRRAFHLCCCFLADACVFVSFRGCTREACSTCKTWTRSSMCVKVSSLRQLPMLSTQCKQKFGSGDG
jgi:hypothetical protein